MSHLDYFIDKAFDPKKCKLLHGTSGEAGLVYFVNGVLKEEWFSPQDPLIKDFLFFVPNPLEYGDYDYQTPTWDEAIEDAKEYAGMIAFRHFVNWQLGYDIEKLLPKKIRGEDLENENDRGDQQIARYLSINYGYNKDTVIRIFREGRLREGIVF